ncbi:hypothetical protein BCR34DRAFT_484353, partial [Clohesyomyces aquaticus]
EDFSSINIILSSNFRQLPLVSQRPLFDCTKQKCSIETHRQHLYSLFNKTIILNVVMRQQRDT